ncbi:MAG: hypothetical protein N4A53_07090 [Pelagimonas sp.]|jgi:hypothetical protein|nr:hypothetical protein [Pelagimonas sp.]
MILDLVIPEHAWKGKSDTEVRDYFLAGIREFLDIFLSKAQEKKRLLDPQGLRTAIVKELKALH